MQRNQDEPGGSSYGGLGYFAPAGGPQGPPPRRPRRAWLTAGAVVLVLLVAAAITLAVRSGVRFGPPVAAPSTPAPASRSSVPPAPEPPLPSPFPRSVSQISTPPVIAGWKGVKDPREKTAYDIPPNWVIDPPDTGRGYGTDDGTKKIILHGTASLGNGFCPQDKDSTRGFVGWEPVSTNADPDTIAGNVAYNMAAVAGADKNTLPQHAVPKVTNTLVYNGLPARTATSTVDVLNPQPCDPPQRTAVTVTFKANIGQVLFVAVFDAGVPGAPGPDVLNKMISSLRDSTWP